MNIKKTRIILIIQFILLMVQLTMLILYFVTSNIMYQIFNFIFCVIIVSIGVFNGRAIKKNIKKLDNEMEISLKQLRIDLCLEEDEGNGP